MGGGTKSELTEESPHRLLDASRPVSAQSVAAKADSLQQWGITMKYMLSWFERPQGSPMEYENAQKRILEVFRQWKAPANFKIELFVIRVGEWGGHMLLDCDDPLAVHKFCSMLPAFVFQVHPVIPVEDAVRGELEVIAWRDGLKRA
ncbi:MAG: DUF3303 domain-containing protein [Stellaceae bacterium]